MVTDRQHALLADLAAARSETLALISQLRPDQLAMPGNDGWSVKDLIAHLASIEPRLRRMWQHALDGNPGPAPNPPIDEYNAACIAERRAWTLDQLVAEFQREGEVTARFIAALPPQALDRHWGHPVRGQVTIESLLWIAPRHLGDHLAELAATTKE